MGRWFSSDARVGEPLLKSCRLAAQLVVAEGSNLLLQQLNVRNDRLVTLQLAGIGITQQELEHGDGNTRNRGAAY